MTPTHASDDTVSAVIDERGKVYGDPQESHGNIGLTWTAIIQQHYGIKLEHPIPDFVVALMMTAFKVQRSARVYKDDNYVDMHAYARFAEEFHINKKPPCQNKSDPHKQ